MKILIIGSEGFIGSHCVNYFKNCGFDVFGCDLLDYKTNEYTYFKLSRLKPTFDVLFTTNVYDYCINASGNGNVQFSVNNPLGDFEANCADVINLLEKIKQFSPSCKYLHISSAAVYGNPEVLPISELSKLSPISPYGWHKLIAEKICEEYAALYKIKIAIIRPFSVYGPKLRKQLFWDLYQKLSDSSSKIEVYGNGKESRDFIFINDLVHLIDIILKNAPMLGEVYNAANGKELEIRNVVQKFISLLNPSTEIVFSNEHLVGSPINWVADTAKIQNLGYSEKYSIDQGLTELTLWIKSLK